MSAETPTSPDDLRESRLRSFLKAVTYRVTGTLTTALLVLLLTGEWSVALAVGALEPVVKIIIYYLHERAWQAVPRGAIRRWQTRRRMARERG